MKRIEAKNYMHSCDFKLQLKRGPTARFGMDGDFAVVSFDELFGDIKTKTRP